MTTPLRRFRRRAGAAVRKLRVPNKLLPVPADLDRDDPVGKLIVRSILIVIGFIIVVGGGVGVAIFTASGAKEAAVVGVDNGQRSACITDLRSAESKAQGEVNDAVLFRLAVLDGTNPDTRKPIADKAEAKRLAAVYVRRGLAAQVRRESASAKLEQPALNDRCGEPAD